MTPALATYPGHRFPAEIIGHAVWLYHVFSLSLRDVELILAERGVVVSHESIRRWLTRRTGRRGAGFGQIPDEYLHGTLGLYRVPQRRADLPRAKA